MTLIKDSFYTTLMNQHLFSVLRELRLGKKEPQETIL